MPDFDIDAALSVPDSKVFSSYHHAGTEVEWLHCEGSVDLPRSRFLCGLICDYSELVIVQLLNGEYLTRIRGCLYHQGPDLGEMVEWLRAEEASHPS